jgi:hypothetical protein
VVSASEVLFLYDTAGSEFLDSAFLQKTKIEIVVVAGQVGFQCYQLMVPVMND